MSRYEVTINFKEPIERRICMGKDKQINNHLNTSKKLESAKTNPNKVKQEIQKDINAGQGDITAREAGGMRIRD